jgi:SNF2 family DNA or RNA helicase
MRSISLHPNYANSDEIEEPNEFIQSSARLKLVISILEKIHSNKEKVLVFCESLAMQEWLAYYIKERFSLEKYPSRIYGQISAEKRTKIVSDFQERNNNFDVLLLSPKAAGVGITLTAATNVIHLTRWWNPAVEDQCTDRAYRIGQTSNVSVYLPRAIHPLYGEGSFDCILHQLLESKRALSREMLLPPELANDADFMINQVSAN